MMREKIVIQEDRIVGRLFEQHLSLLDILRDSKIVSGESLFEPSVSTGIVIEKKNGNRRPLSGHIIQTETNEEISEKTHLNYDSI